MDNFEIGLNQMEQLLQLVLVQVAQMVEVQAVAAARVDR
jgi:hypothetical protein